MSFIGRFSTNEELMIQKQAEVISKLNEDMRRVKQEAINEVARKCRDFDNYKQSHDYYMRIQKAVQSDETIRQEWERFLAVIKLVSEKEIPGLTETERNRTSPFGFYGDDDK